MPMGMMFEPTNNYDVITGKDAEMVYDNLNNKEVKNMEEDKANLDSWEAYSGSFLKAEDVESEQDAYVPVSISSIEDSGKMKIRLHLERKEIKKDFDLNVTNMKKVRELGFESPKSLIGTKIYFTKVQARDPTKGIEVPSLRITNVEKV